MIKEEVTNYLKQMKTKFQDTHELVVLSRLDNLFDLDVLDISHDLQISYIIALPGQNAPETLEKSHADNVIKNAKEIVHLGNGYSKDSMTTRDKWMSDKSDILLVIHNDDENTLTYNAIEYSILKRKPIVKINPKNLTIK